MKVPKIIAKKAGGGYSVAADGKCIAARSNAFAKANKYRQKLSCGALARRLLLRDDARPVPPAVDPLSQYSPRNERAVYEVFEEGIHTCRIGSWDRDTDTVAHPNQTTKI